MKSDHKKSSNNPYFLKKFCRFSPSYHTPHPTPSSFRNLELAKSLLAENIKQNNCFTISIAIIASQSMVILICIILKSNQPVSQLLQLSFLLTLCYQIYVPCTSSTTQIVYTLLIQLYIQTKGLNFYTTAKQTYTSIRRILPYEKIDIN